MKAVRDGGGRLRLSGLGPSPIGLISLRPGYPSATTPPPVWPQACGQCHQAAMPRDETLQQIFVKLFPLGASSCPY
jgi:hypothetical protein